MCFEVTRTVASPKLTCQMGNSRLTFKSLVRSRGKKPNQDHEPRLFNQNGSERLNADHEEA